MKRKFVVTQNVKRFVDLMDTLKNAPANLPKMALVYGDSVTKMVEKKKQEQCK